MTNQLANLTLLSIASLRFNLRLRLIELDLTYEEFETILNFFGGVTFQQSKLKTIQAPKFYSLEAPDVCANCYQVLGTSIGGRVRNGCFYCQTQSYKLQDDLVILKNSSEFEYNETEFYLSKIITELFHN